MKKVLLFLFLLLLGSYFLKAQDFQFIEAEPDTFFLNGQALDDFTVFFDIVNTSSTDTLNILASRISNELAPGHQSFFCWDLCYDSTVNVSEQALSLLPGDTTRFQYLTLVPNGLAGQSSVTMLFASTDSSGESIRRTYHFSVSGSSTTSLESQSRVSLNKIYPNPAHRKAYISYTLGSPGTSAELLLVNLIGKTMMRKSLSPSVRRTELDTSALPSGIYFLRLMEDGNNVASRKLIVRH